MGAGVTSVATLLTASSEETTIPTFVPRMYGTRITTIES